MRGERTDSPARRIRDHIRECSSGFSRLYSAWPGTAQAPIIGKARERQACLPRLPDNGGLGAQPLCNSTGTGRLKAEALSRAIRLGRSIFLDRSLPLLAPPRPLGTLLQFAPNMRLIDKLLELRGSRLPPAPLRSSADGDHAPPAHEPSSSSRKCDLPYAYTGPRTALHAASVEPGSTSAAEDARSNVQIWMVSVERERSLGRLMCFRPH